MSLTGLQWFAVAGKVPAKGTALLVTLREDKGDVAYPGMFIELLAPKKLFTGPGESKAIQPVNITIALLLTDEQHNQFAQRPSLPRVSQLEVLPGGASTRFGMLCYTCRIGRSARRLAS